VSLVSPISYAQMCVDLLLLYIGELKGSISIEVVLVIKAYIWENNIKKIICEGYSKWPIEKNTLSFGMNP
jgi:hypothetical protein